MSEFNRSVMLQNFEETAEALRKTGIDVSRVKFSPCTFTFGDVSGSVTSIEPETEKVKLFPENPTEELGGRSVFAYDESFQKHSDLEGELYPTCHSIVKVAKDDYINKSLLTLYFISSAKRLNEINQNIVYSQDPSIEYKKIYVKDRNRFLSSNVQPHSVLFVDGPVIGGQIGAYNVKLNNLMLSKDVIPIFLVKNSDSRLAISTSDKLKYYYNSDLHWAHELLLPGERTAFFLYRDKHNPRFSKVFCYLKAVEGYCQRIEMLEETYAKYKEGIPKVLNQIYYWFLCQGDKSNPQIRPIVVAEMFARKFLKFMNMNEKVKSFWITPSINQIRFR